VGGGLLSLAGWRHRVDDVQRAEERPVGRAVESRQSEVLGGRLGAVDSQQALGPQPFEMPRDVTQ